MSLAFIFGTNLLDYDSRGAVEFHDAHPEMRRAYDQVAEWTGFGPDQLLHRDARADEWQARSRVGGVSLAAAMVGIHDVLAGHGIRPRVLGGMSLGAMVSSCLSGSLSRRQLFELLAGSERTAADDAEEDGEEDGERAAEPGRHGRSQGVAAAFLPTDYDPDWYHGALREGVYLGGDFGLDVSGACRILLLTGYRDALEKLAAEAPDGAVRVSPQNRVAVHSPLRAQAREVMTRYLDRIDFADPALPVCSCLEQKTLKSADDVKGLFSRNVVEPMNIDAVSREMVAHGTRLGLVVGPSLPRDLIKFPFPVVYVDSPQDIADAVSAIFEFAVELPDG